MLITIQKIEIKTTNDTFLNIFLVKQVRARYWCRTYTHIHT